MSKRLKKLKEKAVDIPNSSKAFIEKLRGEIIDTQLKTGKHYVLTANGIPTSLLTKEQATKIARDLLEWGKSQGIEFTEE